MSELSLICAFVEPQEVGADFSRAEWPLHVTVIPWFTLKSPDLQRALKSELEQYVPFVAQVNHQSVTRYIFPPRGVSVLVDGPWKKMHEAALQIVSQYANTLGARLWLWPYL